MAILSHHDLLATDDIDAGGKSLEALGVLAYQLSREGEDVAGFATEDSLGRDGLGFKTCHLVGSEKIYACSYYTIVNLDTHALGLHGKGMEAEIDGLVLVGVQSEGDGLEVGEADQNFVRLGVA